ncbi:hypothetical protein HMPREF3214_00297 [Alloscardovia omnicolens]|uniref:Uncharacterized protein n=1 Tax=Alloscardovia omnicolens F0580 TaxID=1321816 RepID=U1SFZ8_9BIFI|nr:hypothetical protein HMPREF9244_01640 [Alloscardovia omnicolens F0580]KWZ75740.1 hypothetical protein HMPREF3214_00297 [Alloscardovia omnicolens]
MQQFYSVILRLSIHDVYCPVGNRRLCFIERFKNGWSEQGFANAQATSDEAHIHRQNSSKSNNFNLIKTVHYIKNHNPTR